MSRADLLGGAAKPLPFSKPTIAPVPMAANAKPIPKLAIVIPSFSQWQADTSMAMAGMFSYSAQHAALALVNEKSSMVTRARNNLVQKALDFGADYVLFVDSDMAFPADAAVRLLAHDKDIVAATYNKRVPPYETLGKMKEVPGRDLRDGGLWPCDFLPGGFMMIKRRVFETLGWPWFYETYHRHGSPVESFVAKMMDEFATVPGEPVLKALTASAEVTAWLAANYPYESADRMFSEDYSFCRKARRAGFDVWCDLDLTWQMVHVGEQQVTCKRPPAPEKAA